MDIQNLQTFLAVAKLGSFTQGGRTELHFPNSRHEANQ